MEWFGPGWGAPVNERCRETARPDFPCLACGRAFEEGDRGVVMPFPGDPRGRGRAAYHLRCLMEDMGVAGPED